MKKQILIAILFIIALTTHAQFTDVNVGTSAGSGDGDNLRAAFVKVNANFAIQADSNAVFRTSIGGNYSALADSLAVHLDTLQAHCVSINNLIDSLAIHLDTIQQLRSELNATPFITTGTYIYPRTLTDWVGIGTATPTAALDVSGRIAIHGTGNSVFIGEGAGAADDLGGNENVFIGKNSGNVATSSGTNVGIGSGVMASMTGGNGNVAIGADCVPGAVTIVNGVYIGQTCNATASANNEIAIGTAVIPNGSNTATLGDDNITDFYAGENGTAALHAGATTITGNLSATTYGAALVTDTELGYVDGVTSSIQSQINTKAPIADPTFTGEIGIGSVNVSETELGILEGATLTTTELNYVDGVTSNIQTQLNDILTQGVTWNSATDTYTRLGSLVDIATSVSAGDDYLPIQSDMKRCLLADDGTVNYYIDADIPINKDGTTITVSDTADGTTANKLVDTGADFVTDGLVAGQFVHNTTDDTYSIITAVDDLNTLSLERDIMVSGELYDIGTANFGGADGQVMVEIPKFYYKHTLVSTLNSWYISKYDLPGFELHPAFWKDGEQVDYRYMSAFEGGMYDASTGAMCAKASIPSSLYTAGDKMTSVAGTWAKTNETRAEYRTMAAERGTGFRQLDYYLHSAIQLLYLVEYADFNTQTMIGAGRTNLSGGGWTADSYIGLTGLSVGDGNVTNSVANGGVNYLTDYMTYRGIENWYGNVWKMVDGIAWDGRWTGSAAAQPVYTTNNSDYFADETGTNMKHLCDASYIGTAGDYIGNIENVTGFIPSAGGGSATTDITDYYYQYSELGRNYWRVVLVGGKAYAGGGAGGFALSANNAWSLGLTNFAGRLCY